MINTNRLDALRAEGVTLLDPSTTFIDDGVAIGRGTIVHPGVTLEGRTRIGANCRIRSWVRITDSVIGDNVLVNDSCVIVESQVDDEGRVGPFSHLRPGSHMKAGSHVGNFVELKKTVLGEGSKANHLAYLGDSTIGAGVNIGAGTITCNYDGQKKHPTVIEDGAFIGSDSQLIAPVRVGAGAYVAAGSSITEDVPPGALGIARGRQTQRRWGGRRRSAAAQKTEDRRQKTEDRSQKKGRRHERWPPSRTLRETSRCGRRAHAWRPGRSTATPARFPKTRAVRPHRPDSPRRCVGSSQYRRGFQAARAGPTSVALPEHRARFPRRAADTTSCWPQDLGYSVDVSACQAGLQTKSARMLEPYRRRNASVDA